MKRWHGWVVVLLLPRVLWADLVMVQKVEERGPGAHTGEITVKAKGDKIRVDVSPEVLDCPSSTDRELCGPHCFFEPRFGFQDR